MGGANASLFICLGPYNKPVRWAPPEVRINIGAVCGRSCHTTTVCFLYGLALKHWRSAVTNKVKQAALYVRVSKDDQTIENQTRDSVRSQSCAAGTL